MFEQRFIALEQQRGLLHALDRLIGMEQGQTQRPPLAVVKGEGSDAQEEDAADEGQAR